MANRYWVGGAANWDATAGSKWATTSGGAGGAAVPTAADDVFLDAASGAVTVTLTATGNVRSLNCTGFTGTFIQATSISINIGDATAGAGNVALLFVAGMAYTRNASANMSFISTSATQQTITTGGKTGMTATFNAAGNWIFQDAWVGGAGMVHLIGTLNTNSQTINLTSFSGTSAIARTLTLGASIINLSATSTTWDMTTSTNLTLNAGTSTINFNGASSSMSASNNGGLTYNNVSFNGSGVSTLQSVSNTFNNFTRTGTATKTDAMSFSATGTIITGTLTLTGNSVTNRLGVQSSVAGTARVITAAAVSLTNVDISDITAAGAATPWTGTSLGDALGNSGITFDTPVTQTRTGAGGNWSTAGNWTSRVPLPQDDVVISSGASGTITADMPRLGRNLDFTGFAGVFSVNIVTGSTQYGDLTLASGMTFTTTAGTYIFAGRSTHTITSSGKAFGNTVLLNGPGSTYTLLDTLTTNGQLNVSVGTFTANNFNVTAGSFSSGVATVNMGSGTWNITSPSGVVWPVSASTTLNAGTSTIVISTASASTRTFSGGGKTYNILTYTIANSPGSLTITGANTFNTLNIGSGRILTMPSSTVNTINSGGSFNVSGVNNGYLYLPGVTGNYATVADSVPLSITSDITIDARVALDNWLPTSANVIAAKALTNASDRAYIFRVDNTGTLGFYWSPDGTSAPGAVSTVATGLAAGAIKWVRMSFQPSSGGVYNLKFYLSDDGSTWTQLGATVSSAATSIFDSSQPLGIGAYGSGGTIFGTPGYKIYNLKIYNSYLQNGSGTPVFDADFTTKAFGANSFTESSSNAALVTINGTLAQAGDGRVSLVSSTPGTPATISKPSGTTSVDYLTIQDSTATGGATWFAGANSVNVSGNSGWFFRVPFTGGSFFHVI